MHISMLFLLWAHQLLSRNEIMQPQQFSLEGVLDALPSGPVKRPWHGNKSFRPTRNSLFFFFELRSAKRFMSVFWPHKATDGRVSSGSRTFRRAALCSSHGNHHHKLVCSKGGRERPSRSWAFLFFSIYFFIVILPFFYWPWRLSWWWLPLFLLWPSLSSLNQIFGTKKKTGTPSRVIGPHLLVQGFHFSFVQTCQILYSAIVFCSSLSMVCWNGAFIQRSSGRKDWWLPRSIENSTTAQILHYLSMHQVINLEVGFLCFLSAVRLHLGTV